jgi:hypothetical protein
MYSMILDARRRNSCFVYLGLNLKGHHSRMPDIAIGHKCDVREGRRKRRQESIDFASEEKSTRYMARRCLHRSTPRMYATKPALSSSRSHCSIF